jgi:tRNA modification GTPase
VSQATIYALSSAAGIAGVAVIRMSGPMASPVAVTLGCGALQPRRARRVRIVHPGDGQPIDDALALFFPSPNSFTGEDTLELHIHGGRAVIAATLDALSRCAGCRLAENGEFTRRAFHNGKLDLTEAEGLADLIAAETEAQRKQALRVASGQLRCLYEGWRTDLIKAMALAEASIDFSDEPDVAADAMQQARVRVAALHGALARQLEDRHRGERLRDGFRVVIAGPPNAGKSSLLNALARRDVAIVSPEPGTTRDVVEARLDLGGYPVILSDTAGIRSEASGAIEREGIRRSFARAAEADLVLWLVDSVQPTPEPPPELAHQGIPLIRLRSRTDLAASDCSQALAELQPISTKSGEGMDQLLDLLTRAAKGAFGGEDGLLITSSRQRARLTEAYAALSHFLDGDVSQAELRAEDLRQAAQAIGRLTGLIDTEDVLDQVFAAFCIGK